MQDALLKLKMKLFILNYMLTVNDLFSGDVRKNISICVLCGGGGGATDKLPKPPPRGRLKKKKKTPQTKVFFFSHL